MFTGGVRILGMNLKPVLDPALSRRQFLKGVGVCMTLPALESLRPALAASSPDVPRRFGVVYFPNGAIQPDWWPSVEGGSFDLAPTMKSLEPVKQRMQVLGGLDHLNAEPGPDGAGDHARASGTFLTGVRVRKTAGSDIQAGVSIDQLIARQIGHATRFSSLELTCDSVRKSGSCDSGYSCAYQYNLSWSSSATPVAPEPNPRLVFERLFGAGSHGERQSNLQKRIRQQKSLLDFVLDDVHSMNKTLTYRDREKMDQYLTSVRDIEQRIERAERYPDTPDPERSTPAGIPDSFGEHIDIMFDMMVLAFETDSTRVATFLLANEGSNRAFPDIGIAEGHHYLTHHRNKEDMIRKVAEIDQWYVSRLSRFLQRLDSIVEGNGKTLLQNSMILYGSGNSDGNRHTHSNLPILLAGEGGGALTPGRFVDHGQTPMSNLLLTLADHMGASGIERLGDSTGRLQNA